MVIDSGVTAGLNCSGLTGISFNTATGEMDWTPDFTQAGTYEFKIEGEDFGSLSDDEIFGITVTNVNAPPVLDIISNQTLAENSSIIPINSNDGGDDFDADSETINYTCSFDMFVDGVVGTVNCSTLAGLTFDSNTGISYTNNLRGNIVNCCKKMFLLIIRLWKLRRS